jgi:cholesterol transport system auxiliary component
MKTIFILACMALLAGCVATTNLPPVQHYVLEDLGQAARARRTAEPGHVLLVQPTSVSAFYDTQRLAYSRVAGQRAYYQFAAWTERPGRAFSELLSRRLGAALTTAGVKGHLVLHTRLEEIYHDAATTPGSVKIAVSAQLIDATGRRVGDRRFTRSISTATENAAGAVAAGNQAITQVLDDIAGWIEGVRPGPDQASDKVRSIATVTPPR